MSKKFSKNELKKMNRNVAAGAVASSSNHIQRRTVANAYNSDYRQTRNISIKFGSRSEAQIFNSTKKTQYPAKSSKF